ncbi:putative ankyrin repeat-containing protein-like [Capsicum annuum]|nr:putative ankyrin repeat-containing protein-like [Capsicum annuum]KAF3655307.1 putative ankyrin repeat-containing protein-like [Capsicum annuum]
MDSTLYNAAMRGNIGDANFLLSDHLKRDEENGYQVTPKGNTVLHVAALYGHSHFAAEVLKITPALLCCQNKKNETTLHIAANEGHTEDPEFEFPPNQAQETPLYLAAESGFHDALINILESCKKPTYVAGPSNRTPLHAAVIQEHRGLTDVVSDMLAWKKSLVYLLAGSENDWTTAIHIAASEGYVYMINKLLNQCPDCWDMLNSNNQNALYVAVLNNQDNVVRFLLDSDKCNSLVDEPDSDGNTPLHLLAASGNHGPELINHARAKKMSFNKENQTRMVY